MRYLHHIRRAFVKRTLPRLIAVTTEDHRYTLQALVPPLLDRGVWLSVIGWERLFRLDRAPPAAWVLTDFDRLSPTELETAGHIARALRQGGHTVLNDPCAFRPRHALLSHLHRLGLNRIRTWWPAAGEWPETFPVLLRTIAGHRGPIGDLIRDADSARAALTQALTQGPALADLIFIAFDAAPTADGIWQKHAAFRVGNRILRANTVNDLTWAAKHGSRGAAPPGFYAQELAEMTDYPLDRQVAAIFDAAGLEFGRLDFGLIDGRMAIYEINTNPFIPSARPHPDPSRTRTMALMIDNLATALQQVTGRRDPSAAGPPRAEPPAPLPVPLGGLVPMARRGGNRRPLRG
jgi:hypothetical protein